MFFRTRLGFLYISILLVTSVVGLAGCDARFVDTRVKPRMIDDGGIDDPGGLPVDEDGCSEAPDEPAVISVANFPGDSGDQYFASGSATLSWTTDGGLRVALDEAFETQQAAGVHLVLTKRDSLIKSDGRPGIDESLGDLSVAVLKTVTGAQSFDLPVCAADFTHVWILCEPFGIVFSSALLEVQAAAGGNE